MVDDAWKEGTGFFLQGDFDAWKYLFQVIQMNKTKI